MAIGVTTVTVDFWFFYFFGLTTDL